VCWLALNKSKDFGSYRRFDGEAGVAVLDVEWTGDVERVLAVVRDDDFEDVVEVRVDVVSRI
jgi:hypothetical protein